MSYFPTLPEAEGATSCQFSELEPGDFVKVGGLIKEVKRLTTGTDVFGETVVRVQIADGRSYQKRAVQSCLKRKKC